MDVFFFFNDTATTEIYTPLHPLRSALYHNNGDGTFTDVTEKAGVGGEGHYGQGVAGGGFYNDGFSDLYITGYGSALLFHKDGQGTFRGVTAQAGGGRKKGWGPSAGRVGLYQER